MVGRSESRMMEEAEGPLMSFRLLGAIWEVPPMAGKYH